MIDFEACLKDGNRFIVFFFSLFLLVNGFLSAFSNTMNVLDFLGGLWGLFYPFYESDLWDWIKAKENDFKKMIEAEIERNEKEQKRKC